jgi:hypothetical protein
MGYTEYCEACGQNLRTGEPAICPGCEQPPPSCDCQQTLFFRDLKAKEDIAKSLKDISLDSEDFIRRFLNR